MNKQSESTMSMEEFLALSPTQKRITLAKDALKHLHSEKTFAATRTYVTFTDEEEIDWYTQLDTKIKEKQCYVCALGALLVAEVLYCDNLTVEQASRSTGVYRRLTNYFTSQQLGLMESAFETVSRFARDNGNSFEDAQAATKFGRNLIDKDRMIKILNNIIDNEGEFKP